jgi:hypothetical protein
MRRSGLKIRAELGRIKQQYTVEALDFPVALSNIGHAEIVFIY